MATYILFGKYTQDSLKGINPKRTEKAAAILKQYGGALKAGYALLGKSDLALVVDLPDNPQAMKASVALTKALGIGFQTVPAIPIAEFDKLIG
jgi:uncharacterized protein with GYD domain